MRLPACTFVATRGTINATLFVIAACLVCPSFAGDFTTVVLEVATPVLEETDRGHRIDLPGYGRLQSPGRPTLPEKRILIALPPGSRALSAEVRCIDEVEMARDLKIELTPPIVPLGDRSATSRFVDEWRENSRASAKDDDLYPTAWGELVGAGGLRKYSYAAVSFWPGRYQASTGRLSFCTAANIVVESEQRDSRETVATQASDKVADTRAASLFVNFDDVQRLYAASESRDDVFADYVVITTPDKDSTVQDSGFLEWKEALGHRVTTVLTTDPEIDGQAGADLAEKIRNFLRANWAAWGIEYVLLVGGPTSLPMRYCYPDPSNHQGGVPTDHYYADLTDEDAASWDSDGDGYRGEYQHDLPDFAAEVAVGRIPTNSLARITYALEKIVRTEQDMGAWKQQALHGAAMLFYENEDFSGYPRVDGASSLADVETELMPGWTVRRMSEHDGLDPSTYPWEALSDAAFAAAWRTGTYGIVNWSGHGWSAGAGRVVWNSDDGDGVPESFEFSHPGFIGVSSVLDDTYPSVVFAISCSVGYPEPNVNGRLGVDLLTNPSLGAATAVVAASRSAAASGDWENYPGGAQALNYEFNRWLIAGPQGSSRFGDALYESQFYCHQTYGWDHFYEYQNLYGYNLYGDPAQILAGAEPALFRDDFEDGNLATWTQTIQ